MELDDSRIGQYHIIEQIGRGGMATVYKAFQPSLDRYVAIKVLASDLVGSADFVVRFEREARAAARLRHRNILTVFEYGRQGDLFYLVTEYVSGGTLAGRMGWPLDLTYAVNVVSQVGDALAYAHSQGLIHRDVKPGNILMVDENWPLLADFGLVKIVGDSRHVTASGASVGTPQYMSPEQAQGYTVDQRSDIYSLGAVLYESVAGRPPFGTDSPVAVILRHINEPVTPPHLLRSDLPPALGRVIAKALAKSPRDRYQHMEEFLADLRMAHPLPTGRNPVLRHGPRAIPAGPSTLLSAQSRRRFSLRTYALGGVALLVMVMVAFMLFKVALALRQARASGPQAVLATQTAASSPVPQEPSLVASSVASPAAATEVPASPVPPVPQVVESRLWEADGAEMVLVPAGDFVMGSEELGDDEAPAHQVHLDAFWIDRHEVSNERFARFVAATGYRTQAEERGGGWVWEGTRWEDVEGSDWRHPRGPDSTIEGRMDHPVVLVSWDDADAYCRWAGKRLPSEAQWEKAARGVATDGSGQRYPWGDAFDSARANTRESGRGDTAPVGSFSPQGDSPCGASDMAGNVWEWVADWYGSDYYAQSPSANPPGPATGTSKVLRGGSWPFDEVYARIAFRYNVKPDYTYDFAGFRCVSQ